MALDDSIQPPAEFQQIPVAQGHQLAPDPLELAPLLLGVGDAEQLEAAVAPPLGADMGKAEEIEGLGLARAPFAAVAGGEAAKLQQASLPVI